MKNILRGRQASDRQQIIDILAQYSDPISNEPLTEHQHYEGLVIDNQHLSLALNVTGEDRQAYDDLVIRLKQHLQELPTVGDVLIVQTSSRAPSYSSAKKSSTQEKIELTNINKIIAVASGKGGVGKSTIAVNLAIGLQQSGLHVGLLDADIYGPSIPRMLNLKDRPQVNGNKKLMPLLYENGLKCMSMGLMMDEATPVIWRGPIVQTSFQQLIRDTDWGQLDVLVIDLPPGTGDIHLTLVQKIKLSGAIIVSTPQDIALLDAHRAIVMFQKLGVPILGLVENMSVFICPHCHQASDIFHQGGTRQTCLTYNISLLAEIPLQASIRHDGDNGQPSIRKINDNHDVWQKMINTVRQRLFND